MSKPLLELVHLFKSFAGKAILRDLSLAIQEQEMLVLVGESGCGKSTTLRIIAGLERPDRGSVLYRSQDLAKTAAHLRDVGLVFQSGGTFEHRTVKQNLEISLESLRLSRDQIRDRLAWISDLLGLDSLLHRFPPQLSGGEHQRVALARGLIRQSSLVLLDEPLSNLDPTVRFRMQGELISLRKKLGISMLYVTHDSQEAMSMADRIAVLVDGRIQQCDTPETLYHRPNNQQVALSIGQPPIDIYQATLEKSHEGWYLHLFDKRIAIDSKRLPSQLLSQSDSSVYKVSIGLRASAWSLVSASCHRGPTWDYRNNASRFYGAQWLLEGTIGNDTDAPTHHIKVLCANSDRESIELCHSVSLDPTRIVFFS